MTTVYRADNGTEPETTSYAYTWYTSSTRMQSKTITYPVVDSTENGPGSADVETYVYNNYGQVIWTKDGDGYLNYTAYDPSTGAVVETITDVDTSPDQRIRQPSHRVEHAGRRWVEPDHTGRGRCPRPRDKGDRPHGNVTYTVYDDANHEVRTYPGWDPVTHTTTGPIEVTREYRPAAGAPTGEQAVYDETLTSDATPTYNATTNAPTGLETIDAGNIVSLTREITNNAGQVIETDQYFSLAGVTYATATATLGSASNDSSTGNFYATLDSYDQLGRLDRVESPTGTITSTVYDGLGRVVSTWVGTNDTGATHTNPAGSGSPNNMIEVSAEQYDNGGVGDGNLTQETTTPTPAPPMPA